MKSVWRTWRQPKEYLDHGFDVTTKEGTELYMDFVAQFNPDTPVPYTKRVLFCNEYGTAIYESINQFYDRSLCMWDYVIAYEVQP